MTLLINTDLVYVQQKKRRVFPGEKYIIGDKVEVLFDGKWHPAKITDVKPKRIHVRYDQTWECERILRAPDADARIRKRSQSLTPQQQNKKKRKASFAYCVCLCASLK